MNRRGYTFVELLLVLALLAVLAGMAWPSVLRFSNEQTIKEAGERVRSELDRTRFRAIDEGVTYQFRYEPNGRRYIAVPAEREGAATPTGSATPPAPTYAVASGEISEGLTFQPAPGTTPTGELVTADWLAGLPESALLAQTRWSSPILYRPDGTGTTASFWLIDEDRRYIKLSVRELTGMATAGPLRTETTPWD